MRKHLAVSIAAAAVLGAFGPAHATDSTTRADSDSPSSSDEVSSSSTTTPSGVQLDENATFAAASDSNASSGASWDRNTTVDASD